MNDSSFTRPRTMAAIRRGSRRFVAALALLGAAATAMADGVPTVTVLYSYFGDTPTGNFPYGAGPYGSPLQGDDGNFYGTTTGGGTYGGGTVYQLKPDGTLTVLHSFLNPTDGNTPYAPLVKGSDGAFYGTTYNGTITTSCCGVVYRITASGEFTMLHNMVYGTDGANIIAPVTQGSDGNLYGTAQIGGPGGGGTVFRLTPSGSFSVLHAFTGRDGEGRVLAGGLVEGSDGAFYGTTARGGANDLGTVFKIDTAGTMTTLYSFDGVHGSKPQASLIRGSDGYLYGTAYLGGSGDSGAVFKIDTAGNYTLLHSFNGADGSLPYYGALVEASDGFYGTTSAGGGNYGTIYRITSDGTFTSMYNLAPGTTGGIPYGGLTVGTDGSLYGSTTYYFDRDTGKAQGGTLFRADNFISPDYTPDPFAFRGIKAAEPGQEVTSKAQKLTGFTAGMPVSIVGGRYSINGKAWTKKAKTVKPGDKIRLSTESSADPQGAVSVQFTAGTETTTWTVTTRAAATH